MSRRSIRLFSEREVPFELIYKALNIARYAPSAKNSQPWRFIIVTDKELLLELSKIHRGAQPLVKADKAVVVLGNKDESPTSYLVDASLSALYLWLALHCMGLGAVWIQTLRNIDKIKQLLDIPENYVPVAILAVGYPAEKPKPKPRKDLREITYINKYGVSLRENL